MADTFLDIAIDALREITVLGATDLAPEAVDAQLCLRTGNRMLDAWAARKVYAYSIDFTAYTLVPNLAPHTIGPTGATFTVGQRPVRLEGAALILNNVTPNVDSPILNIRDAAWWNNQRVKSLKTAVPTDVYYNPAWPNGQLNFWPVPDFAYGVRLETWVLLPQFTNLTDPFSFPPAFREAFVLSLAELLCRPFGKKQQEVPDLKGDAARARAIFQSNNAKSPRIASADYGSEGSPTAGSRPTFNYYSGQ
ncbi:MAG: hypothetical protein V4502_08065 [Pseudomonadota bacterium]